MKLAANIALLALFLATPACEALGGNNAGAVDINGLLAGINNQQSAEQAKPMLDTAVAQLEAALAGARGNAEASAAEASSTGGGMVDAVLAQFGVSPETAGLINGLLANEAVRGVLGGTLNQLMGLLG